MCIANSRRTFLLERLKISNGVLSMQADFSVVKHLMSGIPSENQDQPSPISVLETPFEEDEHTTTESSGNNKPEEHGTF